MSQVAERYQKEAVPKLAAELGTTNPMRLPKIQKVVVSVGVGRAAQEARLLETATNTLRKITGQQPVTTKAKHSIAGFKLRQGQKVGLKVTLRRARMDDFLDKLIRVVIPRMRDFHGLPKAAFDPAGNYTIGIPDQTIFPELTYEETTQTHGLQITIVIKAADRAQAMRLLELLGLPLERNERG